MKARYSKHYRISAEELAWLGTRVEELGSVVQTICMERIAVLENAAAGAFADFHGRTPNSDGGSAVTSVRKHSATAQLPIVERLTVSNTR